MTFTRRRFIHSSAALAGAIAVLPYQARAQEGASDVFSTGKGDITVYPVDHASFVMETPLGVIYADPVGGAANYQDMPAPGLILITHEHGDHYDAETLSAIAAGDTVIIANPAVHGMLPEALKQKASSIGNGETTEWNGLSIEAVPAYNITEERKKFHPQGRDNGYVLDFGDFRVYISGDTENTSEMKALENIDLAFLCMNLPFTMDIEQAADAVAAFRPKIVYPYHYRGRDGGTQDPEAFAKLVEGTTEVKFGDWYEEV